MYHRWCSRCLHVFSAMPSDVSKCIDRAISTSSMWFFKLNTNRLLSSNNDYHYSRCQSGNRVNANWVRLGDSNIEKMDNHTGAINVRVIERIRYPLYRPLSRYHDIAFPKLEREIIFIRFIRPCCLYIANSLSDNNSSDKAIAMGWGTVEWGGNSSSDLLKITLNLIPHSECNRIFTNSENDSTLRYGIVENWQICAGGLEKDTCQGDSGGPLIVHNNTNFMFSLVEVTSFGKLCGSVSPGIYTRIYNYVSWIENIVWPDP